MNDRIHQLIEQATEPAGFEGLGGPYLELNPHKFAKLIIKDCLDLIAARAGGPYEISMSPETRRAWNIWIELTEHFGFKP